MSPILLSAIAAGLDSDTYCSCWAPGHLLIPAQTLSGDGLLPCKAYRVTGAGYEYSGFTSVPHPTLTRVRPERFYELQTRNK
jgi:hypothetical protein